MRFQVSTYCGSGFRETEKRNAMQGYPSQKHEVQLGKRTGRPRGAPKGNQNRLTHGGYAAAAKEARAARVVAREKFMLLSAWTDVVWRMQKLEDRGVAPLIPLPPPPKE